MPTINIFFLLRLVAIFTFGCGFFACQSDGPSAPVGVVISEGFSEPLGFYDTTPTFFWRLPPGEGVTAQRAYAIEVTDLTGSERWETGKTPGSVNLAVSVPGLHPRSRQKMQYRVRYWDQDDRPSAWSAPQTVEYGLLDNSDWEGQWVGDTTPTEPGVNDYPKYRPVELRRRFSLETLPAEARLYITAKGLFRPALNGQRIGNDELTPGFTPWRKRLETLTYDVTELLRAGENTLSVTLTEGWYSGRMGYTANLLMHEGHPQLLAQLEGDGEVITVTDESWEVGFANPLTFASIYDGEEVDMTLPAADFGPVVTEALDPAVRLEPKRHAPVREQQRIATQAVTSVRPGSTIFDLGQNMVGVPRLRVPMRKGDTLRVRFAEMLQLDGDVYTENYRSARSTDFYVAATDGTIDWTPGFTFHGFRYVELTGYAPNAAPTADWVEGVVWHSDFDFAGSFTSSHDKLNQLQHNIEWGLRGNFVDIPTDCPQRDERLGWTGDAQVFAPTSLFLTNTHAFWAAWLQSMREDQSANGQVPIFVPKLAKNQVSAGWGDAATIIPWELYFRTGDVSVLEDNYDMMKRWVGFYQSKVEENGLVNIKSFNDWLQPYATTGNRGDTPQEFICTAFFARSTALWARAARVLGKDKEAAEAEALFAATSQALRAAYFDAEGQITEGRGTQTAYLLALAFDLLPEEMAAKSVTHLLAAIEAADGHLRTGFLGTPLLAPVLDRYGHADVMYDILFRETYPSWFYSIDQGATTMWERWNSYTLEDGFHPQGMNSFNHYAYGAIGQWLYERVAGIAPQTAGYGEIAFAPVIGGPLTAAAATHRSPHGEIVSDWSIADEVLTWKVQLPPNTTGFVTLPTGFTALDAVVAADGAAVEVTPVGATFELAPGSFTITAGMTK